MAMAGIAAAVVLSMSALKTDLLFMSPSIRWHFNHFNSFGCVAHLLMFKIITQNILITVNNAHRLLSISTTETDFLDLHQSGCSGWAWL
jgi:hypothetical protein